MSLSVLVTGGLGYVGGRIVERLCQRTDCKLKVGTRGTSSDKPSWLEVGDLVAMDFSDLTSLRSACRSVDVIVHMAALNENDSMVDPLAALTVNGMGTLKLLQAARQESVKRFIYFSTAHVYGAPLSGHITEQTLPRPMHPYAITHRTAEDFVLAAHDKKEVTGIVVRLSNAVGAPIMPSVNRWTLVANELCRQAVTENRLVLRSSGLQRRDFIPLTDVVNAVEHLLVLPARECGNGLFNLGGGISHSILEIAKLIAQRAGTVLGAVPELEVMSAGLAEKENVLQYDVTKLQETGFRGVGEIGMEIDDTLRMCQTWFGRKNVAG